VRLPPNIIRLPSLASRLRLYKNLKYLRADILRSLVLKGGSTPGVKTPLTPDEPGAGQPDVLAAAMGWRGLREMAWCRVRLLRLIVYWFIHGRQLEFTR
jgi:hypothetical protein